MPTQLDDIIEMVSALEMISKRNCMYLRPFYLFDGTGTVHM